VLREDFCVRVRRAARRAARQRHVCRQRRLLAWRHAGAQRSAARRNHTPRVMRHTAQRKPAPSAAATSAPSCEKRVLRARYSAPRHARVVAAADAACRSVPAQRQARSQRRRNAVRNAFRQDFELITTTIFCHFPLSPRFSTPRCQRRAAIIAAFSPDAAERRRRYAFAAMLII